MRSVSQAFSRLRSCGKTCSKCSATSIPDGGRPRDKPDAAVRKVHGHLPADLRRSHLYALTSCSSTQLKPRMKKRILFVCQTLPYPPDGGVWIRSLNTLKILAEEFEVQAVCFERMGQASGRDAKSRRVALAALNAIAPCTLLPVPQAHSRARFAWDHLRSTVSAKPYTSFIYDSRAARHQFQQMRTLRFDLVHLDSLADLAAFYRSLPDAPVVGVHHNVESDLLRRRGQQLGGVKGAYLVRQAALIERLERAYCPRMALNVTVSDADRDQLRAIAPSAKFETIPNGVDTAEFAPLGSGDSGVVFVGGLSWHPNKEALDFWCEHVTPQLRELGVIDVPTTWVGQATAEQVERYHKRHGVRLTGYVDDVRPVMAAASVFVVPLQSGGGTRLKILNAWAMAMPVVSTSVGCEGLSARHGENILIADSPEEFAGCVSRLLNDKALRATLGQRARETVLKTYDWQVIGRTMRERYRGIIDEATHRH